MCNIIYIAGNGIEPLYKDFQSNALPLSYPADQMKHKKKSNIIPS